MNEEEFSQNIKDVGSDYPLSTVALLTSDQSMADSMGQIVAHIPDIKFYHMSDPAEAFAFAQKTPLTLVFLDLSLSHKQGIDFIVQFRANPLTHDVPVIVFSPSKDLTTMVGVFAVGANDYLFKLPDPAELIARIRCHSVAYFGLCKKNQAFEYLQENQKLPYADFNDAATYVTSLLPAPLDGKVKTSWRFIPSMVLGGDGFGYHWVDDDHFAFYLLDVCGHGVEAALLSISVKNVLRTQALSDTDFLQPPQVLEALNKNFPMEQHNNMFLTIWYGVYNQKSRMLSYTSGGHPPAVLISSLGGETVVKELSTYNLVIGALPKTKYQLATCKINEDDTLYLFSDGIYELQNPKGLDLSWKEFIEVLSKRHSEHPKEDIDRVLDFAYAFVDGKLFVDDVSIMEIVFR